MREGNWRERREKEKRGRQGREERKGGRRKGRRVGERRGGEGKRLEILFHSLTETKLEGQTISNGDNPVAY